MFISFSFQFIMGFESTYHWEDPIYTGVVFGTVMATLISICYYSLISVCAYTSLFILMCVAGLKLYTYVMVTFLKKETANPIAKYTGKKTNNFINIWHFILSQLLKIFQITYKFITFYVTSRNGRNNCPRTS